MPALADRGASGQDGVPSPSAEAVPALHDALPGSVKDPGVPRFAGDSHPSFRSVGHHAAAQRRHDTAESVQRGDETG
ncbi:hypothetical protein, partial [Streptomyces minutiscleroticus]|uniref:hypothetical protein n=1 Tax=Streptomyces minutiscleroticus TaxID=68238 RepID=UPI00332AB812